MSVVGINFGPYLGLRVVLGETCPPSDTINSFGCENQVQPNLVSTLVSRDCLHLCLLILNNYCLARADALECPRHQAVF